MRKIPLWALRPGMIVAKKVFDTKGSLLLNTGVKLEVEYIQKLKKLQIPAIYVVDQWIPDVQIEDIIKDETKQKANNLVKDLAKKLNRGAPLNMARVRDEIESVVNEIINQLLDNNNLIINLSDIKSIDNYTFAHSVNVAVLSLTIAVSMGFSRRELSHIGCGALLHDLGKTMVPLQILNKKGGLTPQEREIINKHPEYGVKLVQNRCMLGDAVNKIIFQHHERVNGAGYPQGLRGNDIHPFSKIVAIADTYDALVSDRPYREALPPYRALDVLETMGEEYDADTLQVFYQHVAAYPVGTVVGLSNGEVGVVVNNTAGYPRRPRVRVIAGGDDFSPVKPYEVDLAENLTVVINRVYEENELPRQLFAVHSQNA